MLSPLSAHPHPAPRAAVFDEAPLLLEIGRMSAADACARIESSVLGLTAEEALARLKQHGPNVVTREQKPPIWKELWQRAYNPLNALLVVLACVSYVLGDTRAAVVVLVMVVLAVVTSFVQEHRSNV